MAIETQFTIRSVSVEQALKEAEAKVDRSAKKMDSSLSSVGSGTQNIEKNLQNAAKGMDSISKVGGKAGGVMKNLTESITGMLSPIGLVSAGITALISLFIKMQEQAKQRIQALKDWSRGGIADVEKRITDTQKEMSTDRGYMDRLIEISKYEEIDNATKQEAIRIISLLTSKYGDLGLSIDNTTGKVLGLVEAIEQFNKKQIQREGADTSILIEKNKGLVDTQDAELQKELNGFFSNPIEMFSPPMTKEERKEMQNARIEREAYARSGYVITEDEIPTPLNDARKAKAEKRKTRYFANDIDTLRTIANEENDEKLRGMVENYDSLTSLINDNNTSEQDREAYQQELEYLQQLMEAYNKAQVAQEMMDAKKEDPEVMKQWKERRDAALDYIQVLERGIESAKKLRTTSADPNDKLIKERGKEAQDLIKKTQEAEKQRDSALEKKQSTETSIERGRMTKEQLQQAYQIDNNNALDRIEAEKQKLETLKKEYSDMTEMLKEYDKYKDENGNITDKEKNAEYLELSNKITANKLAQVEAETRIAEAQTEQLGIQEKLKVIEEQRAKEQREQILNRMKETMKGLFSNVLGDMSERTNSLTQRGGYLKGTNTINSTMVNRQILNTVMAANSYLSSISRAMSSVGRIN